MVRMSKSRRDFCKNVVFAGAGLSFLPFLTNADNKQPLETSFLSLRKKVGKVVIISGKVCFENLKPAANITIEVCQNNSENNPLEFEYEGKLTTDSEGNYTFETDFPEKFFEDEAFKMRRVFFKIIDNNGKEVLTKLYFGESGKAFIDGNHVENTPKMFRNELPKTKIASENFSRIQFNIYLNS